MCGIAGGFTLRAEQTLKPEAMLPMISVLAHRGPDDWGYYLDGRSRVMLLHSRLSIVDLESGRQPLANEDGSVWVACNGELYGFQEIAEELRARGHRFRTRSDSEIIVHLYEEYGERFVEHLRGEFALALYDLQNDRLYLVRDRFGIKPLYYTTVGDTLLFGSEIKALLSYPGMRAEFDPEYVFHLLGGVLMPGETLMRGIRQLEPGCMLRIDAGKPQQIRYWDLPFHRSEAVQAVKSPLDEKAAVEEFRSLFDEAVTLRLHGDVEVGAYLSGGIDSAAVALVMARHTRKPVQAFTVSFADPSFDELDLARAIADAGEMEHHVLRVGPGGLAEPLVQSLWHSETPTFNTHGTAKFILSELAGKHVKVVQTGQGADELLAGYDQFEHQLLLDAARKDPNDRHARRRLETFRPRSGHVDVLTRSREYPGYQRVVDLFGTYPYPLMRPVLHQPRIRRLLAREFRRTIAQTDSPRSLAQRIDRSQLAGLPSTSASQYLLFKTDLPSYILTSLVDRPEMAHSVEGRLPFLDHKLVEFACRLPVDLKINERDNKYVLRQAMADLVPEAVRTRPKKQFLAPCAESLGLDRPSNLLVETYLTPDRIREAGIFDPGRLKMILWGVRFLPKGSYYQVLCEAIATAALSLHILHDLFCRDFPSAASRFSKPGLDYRLSSPTPISRS